MKTSKSIVAVLLAWMLAASAQQPKPQQQPNAPLTQQTYKFEATTQLVIVNVSVKDRDGKPIENLKPSDFTLSEDGKPQQVKIFEAAGGNPVGATRAHAGDPAGGPRGAGDARG
jgi:hypothetical protein